MFSARDCLKRAETYLFHHFLFYVCGKDSIYMFLTLLGYCLGNAGNGETERKFFKVRFDETLPGL